MRPEIPGYQLADLIGEDVQSWLFRGQRIRDSEAVLLKIPRQESPAPGELARYQREYDIVRNLEIDGLLQVRELGHHRGRRFLVFEDSGAVPLKSILQTFKQERARPAVADVLRLAIDVVACVGQIHGQRLVHRDLSPQSILWEPETGVVKITELGIATSTLSRSGRFQSPRTLGGTLAYMAPEQTGRINRSVDYRSDLYSLGVTFYELLTLRLPFEATEVLELVHCHLAVRPESPHRHDTNIPRAVSDVVVKLLAKMAEDRYQSAWGLRNDLEYCLEQIDAGTPLLPFPLGSRDASDRFALPQRLYGRESQLSELRTAFERIAIGEEARDAEPELLLIRGQSGIGKTALVHELHKPITASKGYFVGGKFAQLQRDRPYSALGDAFSDLVRLLLTEDEKRLESLRRQLLGAFRGDGQMIIDLIPQFGLVVEAQSPVRNLSPEEANTRFRQVFYRVTEVFCQPEHPLVLFLDDLQWADSASLGLIELLISEADLRHLLIIGAYRDEELELDHPLSSLLEKLAASGKQPATIELQALETSDIEELLMDTLDRTRGDVAELAELVSQKTHDNPFFVRQFLKTLHQESMLVFEPPRAAGDRGRWTWDMGKIRAMNITDNVVEFTLGKLRRLPGPTQEVLKLAACMGNRFDPQTLSAIGKRSPADASAELAPAVDEGLVVPVTESPDAESAFVFAHDRFQHAAYALLDESERRSLHLRVGRLLLAGATEEERFDNVFSYIDHFNFCEDLVQDAAERMTLAWLSRWAGEKAMASVAHRAARHYLSTGLRWLPSDGWTEDYDLTLTLHMALAEVEYLLGDFETSEQLIDTILEHAEPLDQATAFNILIIQLTLAGKYVEAIEAGRRALDLLGHPLPEEDLDSRLEHEIDAARRRLGDREPLSLLESPETPAPAEKISLEILKNLGAPTYIADQALFRVSNLISVNISLEHGSAPGSILGYSNYGLLLSSMLGEYAAGYEFGLLALRLSEWFGDLKQKSTACFMLANVLQSWVKPVQLAKKINWEGHRASIDSGEVLFTGYIAMMGVLNSLFQGEELAEVEIAITKNLAFTRQTKNQYATDLMEGCLMSMRRLGVGESGDCSEHSEQEFLAACRERHSLATVCLFHLYKAQALYLLDDLDAAFEAISESEKLLSVIPGYLSVADCIFYAALVEAALLGRDHDEALELRLKQHLEQLRNWAQHCPENFEHRYLLAQAEQMRAGGDLLTAIGHYRRAAESARINGFTHVEAIADERLGRLWLELGEAPTAAGYLSAARRGYAGWGARRKVEDMEARYAQWLTGERRDFDVTQSFSGEATLTEWRQSLDLTAILKASQAISKEIQLRGVLTKILQIVLEHAGAETATLLLRRNGKLTVEAEGSTASGVRHLDSRPFPSQMEDAPVQASPAIVSYVARTQETVVLDLAIKDGLFASDPYIARGDVKSVACVPITKQSQLVGVLYLENNLNAGVFSADRLEVLRLLTAQSAISIEIASLYASLEEANRTLEQKVEERTREIVHTQEQLKMREKMESMNILSAGFAHELRNPLNFIANFSLLLQERVEDLQEIFQDLPVTDAAREDVDLTLADIRDNTAAIERHGKRAARIVDDINRLARRERGEVSSVAVNQLVREYAEIARETGEAEQRSRAVSIREDFDLQAGNIEAVPQSLSQVIINLVQNAIDAVLERSQTAAETDYQPEIVLATLSRSDSVEIRIRDNGVGVDADAEKKLFSPFFTTKKTGSGNIGLGLAICYDIVVEEHFGEIRVESEPSSYTEFILRLPRRQPGTDLRPTS